MVLSEAAEAYTSHIAKEIQDLCMDQATAVYSEQPHCCLAWAPFTDVQHTDPGEETIVWPPDDPELSLNINTDGGTIFTDPPRKWLCAPQSYNEQPHHCVINPLYRWRILA